jgi:protease-4
MQQSFLTKHPFIKGLLKRIATISVSWATIVVCLVVTLSIFGFMFAPSDEAETDYSYIYGDGMNEMLSIPINGTIVGSEDEAASLNFLSDDYQTSGYKVKEQLYAAADDDLINGVVLEINSPGGTIYGSRAIADGVKYYKEKTGNPVYAYVQGMAASGAYWVASSTDKIIADYGSDIGSIGVVMGPFQYYNNVLAEDGGMLYGGVVTQNGIENTTITAGKSKDIGSPYRRLTQEEVTTLQKAVNNEYDDFVRYVSKQRKIDEPTLRNTIGAMTYDNKSAHEYKLIDQSGSKDDAYNQLAKAAGIEDDFTIIREERIPGFVESLLEATVRKPKTEVKTFDTCSLTRSTLAYHGDVSAFCNKTGDN